MCDIKRSAGKYFVEYSYETLLLKSLKQNICNNQN